MRLRVESPAPSRIPGPGPARALTASLWTVTVFAASASPAPAAQLSAVAGCDYSMDANRQGTSAVIGITSLAIGGGDLLAGGLRYDHQALGVGFGVITGGGVSLGEVAQLRALATFLTSEAGSRALRLKVGPQIRLRQGQSLAFYYTRDEDDGRPRSDGVLTEAAFPIHPTLKTRGALGYAVASGAHGAKASAGVVWSLLQHLELAGEVGFFRSGPGSVEPTPIGTGGPAPPRRLLPFADGVPGDGASNDSGSETLGLTTLWSVRVSFP